MFTDGGASGFFNVNNQQQQQQQQQPQYSNQGGHQQQNQQAPTGPMNQYGGQGGGNRRGGMEPRKSKVFTPVTVRMIMNSQPRPDDICEFDGDPINDIILVGRLLRRVEEPMRTQFELNDNTGTFHVLFYHKGENQVPTALRNFNYDQFCYAKVYGNIRVFKEEKAIVGTHIKRIEKFDEMTNHFLSTYVAHCIRKKGVLKPRELAMDHNAANGISDMSNACGNSAAMSHAGGSTSGASAAAHDQQNRGGYQNHQQNFQEKQQSAAQSAAAAPAQGNSNGSSGGPLSGDGLRAAILDLMKTLSKSKKMIHKGEVLSMLQGRTNQSAFEQQLENLLNDGDICQSFDSDHFCLVD